MHFKGFEGLKQFLKYYVTKIVGCVWYDEHLFRDCAMSQKIIGNLVEWWSEKCFDTTMKAKSLNG